MRRGSGLVLGGRLALGLLVRRGAVFQQVARLGQWIGGVQLPVRVVLHLLKVVLDRHGVHALAAGGLADQQLVGVGVAHHHHDVVDAVPVLVAGPGRIQADDHAFLQRTGLEDRVAVKQHAGLVECLAHDAAGTQVAQVDAIGLAEDRMPGLLVDLVHGAVLQRADPAGTVDVTLLHVLAGLAGTYSA